MFIPFIRAARQRLPTTLPQAGAQWGAWQGVGNVWVNPRHVVSILEYDAGVTQIVMEVGEDYNVLGTPEEVALRLNGMDG
jgi:hypothetical protein